MSKNMDRIIEQIEGTNVEIEKTVEEISGTSVLNVDVLEKKTAEVVSALETFAPVLTRQIDIAYELGKPFEIRAKAQVLGKNRNTWFEGIMFTKPLGLFHGPKKMYLVRQRVDGWGTVYVLISEKDRKIKHFYGGSYCPTISELTEHIQNSRAYTKCRDFLWKTSTTDLPALVTQAYERIVGEDMDPFNQTRYNRDGDRVWVPFMLNLIPDNTLEATKELYKFVEREEKNRNEGIDIVESLEVSDLFTSPHQYLPPK